jgi:hypothetical protein
LYPEFQDTEIQGNEHADRPAKAGLNKKAKNPLTTLSYLERKAKEELLASWRPNWKDAREKKKARHTARPHKTGLRSPTRCRYSLGQSARKLPTTSSN